MPNPLYQATSQWQQPDDEEQSLWRKLGNVGLSGVAAIGNVLDVPGAAARSLLAGQAPVSLLPWHWTDSEGRVSGRDLMRQYGLVGQENTYSNFAAGMAGEILLDPLTYTGFGGLLKAGAKGATTGGSKGLLRASIPFTKTGTELFTSPAAQKFASRLGTAAEAVYRPSVLAPQLEKAAEYMPAWMQGATEAPLANGIGGDAVRHINPNTNAIQTSPIPAGQEKLFEAAAKAGQPQGQQWAKDAAEMLTYPARSAMKLFHPPSIGGLTEAEQRFNAMRHPELAKAAAHTRGMMSEQADQLKEVEAAVHSVYGGEIAGQLAKASPELAKSAANAEAHMKRVTNDIVRMTAETSDVQQAIEFHGLDAAKSPELQKKLKDITDSWVKTNDTLHSAYKKRGGQGASMAELAKGVTDEAAGITEASPSMRHFPRAATPEGTGQGVFGWMKALLTRPDMSKAREEATRYLPQSVVEKIAHDDAARGIFSKEQQIAFKKAGVPEEQWAAKHIEDTYGKWIGNELTKVKDEAGNMVDGPKYADKLEHATALAAWAKKPHGWPMYQNDVLATQSKYAEAFHQSIRDLDAIHSLTADSLGETVDGAWRPMVPAVEGLPKGAEQLQGTMDFTQSLQGQRAVGLKDLFTGYGNMDAKAALEHLAEVTGEKVDDLEKMAVPLDVANAIKASRKVAENPSWWSHIGQILDVPTSYFKQNVTLPFASFAARNSASGHYMNIAGGDIRSLSDLKDYGSRVKDLFERWKSGTLSPEMEREWFTNGVLSGDTHFEGVQYRNPEFGKVLPDNPLQVKKSFMEAGQDLPPSELDRVPGLRTARQAHGAVLATGAKANALVEFTTRVPMYEYLKAKGMSPADAAKRVLELQVDYSSHAFSPFEGEVMRRIMPFYAYQRRIAPVVLKTLLNNPAGVMGQTIRASRLASSDDPTTPSWIGDTLAIPSPFGSKEEGGRAYITGFGLPHEAVAGYLGGGLRGAGRQALSQLNPLIKAPLEWATGQSFFQTGPSGTGRPLDELNPPIGQTLANVASVFGRDASRPVDLPDALEFAAANSPASRFISTARQLTDPRKTLADKALNTLTGIRIAEVSPAAADSALASRVGSLLKDVGGRTFSEAYVPKDRLAAMSPAERDLAEKLIELKKTIAKRGKQRKKNAIELAAAQ